MSSRSAGELQSSSTSIQPQHEEHASSSSSNKPHANNNNNMLVLGSPSQIENTSSSSSASTPTTHPLLSHSTPPQTSSNHYHNNNNNNNLMMMVNVQASSMPSSSPLTTSTHAVLIGSSPIPQQQPSSSSGSSSHHHSEQSSSNGSASTLIANTSSKSSTIALSSPSPQHDGFNDHSNLKDDQGNNSLMASSSSSSVQNPTIITSINNQTTPTNGGGNSTIVSLSPQPNNVTSHPQSTTTTSEKTTKTIPTNMSSTPTGTQIPIPPPPNVSAHLLPYTTSTGKTQLYSIPPLTLCVLMDQLANKIHQHYNPLKPQVETRLIPRSASTASKEPNDKAHQDQLISSRNNKNEGSSSLSSTKQPETPPVQEDLPQTEQVQKQVPSTSSRSRSTSTSKTAPSLIDLLTEEFHANPSGYNDIAQATNVLIEFLYGNTDMKDRRSVPSYPSSQHSSPLFFTPTPYTSTVYSYPYHQPPPIGYQVITEPSQHHVQHVQPPRSMPSTSSTAQPSSKVKTTNAPNAPPSFPPPIIVQPSSVSDLDQNSKPSSSPIPPSIQTSASSYSPSKGFGDEKSSSSSTPIRIRCAPSTTSTNESLSSSLFLRKDESVFEPSTEENVKKKRGNKKSNEADTTTDEQDSRFSCYICDKSVVDKNTKYTLTSNNYSSFAEVFPHVKIPMYGESKRICANCYHKKYRNARKKKEQSVEEKKETTTNYSVQLSYLLAPSLQTDMHSDNSEPTNNTLYTCCICSKSSTSPSFVDTNAINSQNYHAYQNTFPHHLPQQFSPDRLMPICESCKQVHENDKKRKQPPSSSTENEASKKLKQ